jgi:hypothetical protein
MADWSRHHIVNRIAQASAHAIDIVDLELEYRRPMLAQLPAT